MTRILGDELWALSPTTTVPIATVGEPDGDLVGQHSVIDTNQTSITLPAADVTANSTGTATYASITVRGDGSLRTITLTGISDDGSLAMGTATDSVNQAAAIGTSATSTVDHTAKPSGVNGKVYLDYNANGVPDAGEPGLAVRVVLADFNHDGTVDAGDPTATTDVNGLITFPVMLPGSAPILESTDQDASLRSGGNVIRTRIGRLGETQATRDKRRAGRRGRDRRCQQGPWRLRGHNRPHLRCSSRLGPTRSIGPYTGRRTAGIFPRP